MELKQRLLRAWLRSVGWWAAGLVFLLLSFPAFFDLETLFRGLAVVCWLLAGAVAGFTYADRRTS